jgi:ribosome-associated heat shock protein Hsp15
LAKPWNYNHRQLYKPLIPCIPSATVYKNSPNTSNFDPKWHLMDKIRIDKWLWAARFYKTRSLATDEIGKGRVAINDQTAKASREVKVGDMVSTRQGDITRTLKILALSDQRGPAPVAQALYEETPESIALREKTSLQRRLAREPALSIEQGRPTKRNRRELEKAKEVGWNNRWSASLDES